ncbi:carcinoembryonic antigen-related cell adhesion molecule 3-like, partial [Sigmodon hispidus]
TARVTIEPVPPQVAKGQNILLLVHNLPKNIKVFAWIKGVRSMDNAIAIYVPKENVIIPGREHSGRVTVYRNGSLLLQNANEKDRGLYTLRTFDTHADIVSQTSMYLFVYPILWNCGHLDASSKLSIESVPPRISEGKSVLLLVHNLPENNIGYIWYKWITASRKVEIARYTRYPLDKTLTEWGPAYSGRETLFSDGTLMLHDVTHEDLKLYTVQILRTYVESEEAHVQLQMDNSLSPVCNPLTLSKLMIQAVPQYPAERESVLLLVHNLPEDLKSFSWHKSEQRSKALKIVEYRRATNSFSWGPTYKRRGRVYSNRTLVLRHVTEKDAGMYTLSVLKKDSKSETAYVEIYVKRNVTQPFVRVTDTTVAGRRSVTFSCISPDTDTSIRWIFNNKNLQLSEKMTLSPTKCGLKIEPFWSGYAGEYQCEVSNRFSLKTSPPVSWS